MRRRTGLRAPARPQVVARHYLGMLSFHSIAWGLGLVFLAVGGSGQVAYDQMASMLPLLFFLPLGHWSVAEGRAVLDAAMPLDRVRHELVRVVCGAWSAAVALAASIVVAYAMPGRVPLDGAARAELVEFPSWYPLALFSAGLAWYLLGSAVLLRAERPGRVFVLLAVLIRFAFSWLPSGTWESLMLVYRPPAELARLGAAEWLGGTALPLGLACAIVYAAVRLDLPRVHAPSLTVARLRRALPHGAARAPVRRAGLRRPPSVAVVAWRHVALLRHRMAWPVLLALFLAWNAARAETGAAGTLAMPPFASGMRGNGLVFFAALFWPVLVWLDRDGPQREHREALPVGTLGSRIFHAAAGAAWLLSGVLVVLAGWVGGAVAAGTLASPADVPPWLWLGIPCGVLTLYLFGTFTTVLSERPVLNGILAAGVLMGFSMWDGPVSPRRALPPLGFDDPSYWRPAAAAGWLLVCAAAALGALALTVWGDRYGRFPTPDDAWRSLRPAAPATPPPLDGLRSEAGEAIP